MSNEINQNAIDELADRGYLFPELGGVFPVNKKIEKLLDLFENLDAEQIEVILDVMEYARSEGYHDRRLEELSEQMERERSV